MDTYTALINQEAIKDYYAFPSQIPKAFYAKTNFFSFVELQILKWILYPYLFQNHWILFAFELKAKKIRIFNSLPKIALKKTMMR